MRRDSVQTKNLASYLNDHLAASVTAIKLLSRLEKSEAHGGLARFAARMRDEIEQDQAHLKKLMRRLGIKQARTRKATGWFAEKLMELKLKFDDPQNEGLGTFEILEIVEVGIGGKRALWKALAFASEDEPALRGVDYEQLSRRAEEQHHQMEGVRLASAREAFVA